MTRATLIYNPVAGRNPVRRQAEIRSVADVFRQAKVDLRVEPTTGPGSAQGLARSAATAGAEAVVVCGGDGTINEVVNGLALSACPLAILPGGTANIAARDLGLSLRPVVAARDLAHARTRRIALGRVTWGRSPGSVNGGTAGTLVSAGQPGQGPGATPKARYFLSVAGVGFDAYVVHHLGSNLKRDFGVTAYVWKAFEQLWRYGFPPFLCQSGDREWRGRMALVQRTERYAGWLHMSPGSSLLNPEMKLFLFQGANPWRYFFCCAALVLRRHLHLRDLRVVESWPLNCCAESAAKTIRVELDGEEAGELPATFELVPDALTLLLPEKLAG
ncbi:MAG TPA: diacylglycerol kinase family protein [Terriglobia bacterium]|nr:diacylglycerol kinase family protein [Terriglobia bacterium]